MFAINPDGTEKWVFEGAVKGDLPPVIAPEGTIYAGSKDGQLFAINGSNGGLADTSWPMYKHDPQHTGNSNSSEINFPPSAGLDITPKNPEAGEKITFDASLSTDQDGQVVQFKWDWDDNWEYDETTTYPETIHTFSSAKDYKVILKVVDNGGASDTTTETVSVTSPDTTPPDPNPMT